jgi:hypothetical protein
MQSFCQFVSEATKVSTDAPTIIAAMKQKYKATRVPAETRFLLPDGTRLTFPLSVSHEHAAQAAGYTIDEVLAAGVLRYFAHFGIQLTNGTMTAAQAQIVADDWIYYRHDLDVDVQAVNGHMLGSKEFDSEHLQPAAIRGWANRTQYPAFHEETLREMPEPFVQLKKILPPLGRPEGFGFILPDGTALGLGGYNQHERAVQTVGMNLGQALKAGIARYVGTVGITVSAPLTNAQARVIEDNFRNEPLAIDVMDPTKGRVTTSKTFTRHSVQAIQMFVSHALDVMHGVINESVDGLNTKTWYHGTSSIVQPNALKVPAFLTTSKTGASWYAHNRGDNHPAVYAYRVQVHKPFEVRNMTDAERLRDILVAGGVQCSVTNGVHGWEWDCPDVRHFSSYDGENPFDVVYVPNARVALMHAGYDAFYNEHDELEQGTIEALVVFSPSSMTHILDEMLQESYGRFSRTLDDSLKPLHTMTWDEFNHPPAYPTGVPLYAHVTDVYALPDILKHGLLLSKSKGRQNHEPTVIWATKYGDVWGSKSMFTEQRLVVFSVPDAELSGSGIYQIHHDVPPSAIVAIEQAGFSSVSSGTQTVREERTSEYADQYFDAYRKDAGLREDVRLSLDRATPGHVYRGITEEEADSIRRTGRIQSTLKYSHGSEGTSFATDFNTAESYINYGRDNPATTGKRTYVLEVERTATMHVDHDGYVKSSAPVSSTNITHVWVFQPDGTVTEREALVKEAYTIKYVPDDTLDIDIDAAAVYRKRTKEVLIRNKYKNNKFLHDHEIGHALMHDVQPYDWIGRFQQNPEAWDEFLSTSTAKSYQMRQHITDKNDPLEYDWIEAGADLHMEYKAGRFGDKPELVKVLLDVIKMNEAVSVDRFAVSLWHGTRTEPHFGKDFGGLHIGTKRAALERLDNTPGSRIHGKPGHEKLFPVSVTTTSDRVFDAGGETEMFFIVNDANKLKDMTARYDVLQYTNDVEDAGSTSYLILNPHVATIGTPIDVSAKFATGFLKEAMDARSRLERLKRVLTITNDPKRTAFMMPDGTRLAFSQGNKDWHETSLGQTGYSVAGVMDLGVVRYKPGVGFEASRPLTMTQARQIIDDFKMLRANTIFVDVRNSNRLGHGGTGQAVYQTDVSPSLSSKAFDIERVTPEALRTYVQFHAQSNDAYIKEDIQHTIDARLHRVHGSVDGRRVTDDVPNMSSISASLYHYDILDDIRAVPMSDFEDQKQPSFYSTTEADRVKKLAADITHNKWIDPLIVVYDKDHKSPYVLEGGHRFDALKLLHATTVPALVVIDLDESINESASPRLDRVQQSLRDACFILDVLPGDVKYHVVEVPVNQITTRERGKRYPNDGLTAAYENNPAGPPPIAIQERGGSKRYTVLDGHHRLMSAKAAGLDTIWSLVVDDVTKDESHSLCATPGCGHWKTMHNGSFQYGWGDCTETGCKCQQFTIK